MLPPKKIVAFLRWFCREDYIEEIEGDLTELFEKEQEYAPRRARMNFTWRVLRYLRPEFIKKWKLHHPQPFGMYKSYFKIGWRNLLNNKVYSFINIGGLAMGICVCMLILLYVAHEWSFDRFHPNASRIFSPMLNFKYGEHAGLIDRLSYQTASIIKEADPAVESMVRVKELYNKPSLQNTENPDRKFTEEHIALADSNYFGFFSFPLLQGNPQQVLSRPFTLVISEQAATRYFGDANPVGKTMKYEDGQLFEITGVMAAPPSNSSIHYDFILSMASIGSWKGHELQPDDAKFGAGEFKTFLLLRDPASKDATEKILQRLANVSDSKFNKFQYSLNPLVNRHSDFDSPSNARYRRIFSWVAALVLFLALINYMSLATARSSIRSKEVGVRRVLGANRSKIINQFYVESGLYAGIAFLLALVLFLALRPAFYQLLQLRIDDSFIFSRYALLIYAGLFLATMFISGSYPSLVLSGFKPINVLYGKISKDKGGAIVRRFFTVLQFTISIALIISSLLIGRQLDYFRNMDTGISRELVVMVPFQKNISQHFLAFKRQVESINGVEKVSTAAAPLYDGIDMTMARSRSTIKDELVSQLYVDQHFIDLLDMKWKMQPASEKPLSAKGQIVINEEMARTLNLPPDPRGESIFVGGDTVQVAGVLKDFNFHSLRNKISALCVYTINDTDSAWYSDNGDCLFVKISAHTNIPTLLAAIGRSHDALDKQSPFTYRFLDDAFDAQYRAEQRLATIFRVFTIITVLIACLGLLGLAAFTASQRTKEIGIRKVLGANSLQLVSMVSGSFIKPVLVAIIIAIPLAWIFMNQWLQDFAYRTNLPVWIFILAALLAVLIAILTVSFHAIKVAISNPVKNLRTE